MRPLVNLSSEPFQNRRLFWVSIIVIFAVSVIFGAEIFSEVSGYQADIQQRQERIKKLELQLAKSIKPVRTDIKITPDQNFQLVAAHELISKKSFSWSQLLNDIEKNIPPGVRVLKIGIIQGSENAKLDTSNNIVLAMDVIGKSQNEVTKMMDKFIASGKFNPLPVLQKPIEGSDEVEFSLKIDYFPTSN